MRATPLWLAAALALAAPQELLAYRPFDSTDASVVQDGEVEVELGTGWLREDSDDFAVAPALILNGGVMEGWEIVLQGRSLFSMDDRPHEPDWQLVDSGVFAKGVLRPGSLQGRDGPSIATEFGALLPTVHGTRGAGATLVGIVSDRWDWGTVHVNGAASLTRAHHFDLFGGLILEGPYAWPVRPALELFVEREFGTAWTYSGLVGAIWRMNEVLSFDVGFRVARAGDADVREARAGLTWVFDVWSGR